MSEKTFQTGDLVRLKSGGPMMTVTKGPPLKGPPLSAHLTASNKGSVVCKWFNADNDLQEGRFHGEELIKRHSPA